MVSGSRDWWVGASLAVLALFTTACADDNGATQSESSDAPVNETTASIESTTTDWTVQDPEPSTTSVDDVDRASNPWELEQSMPGDLGQVVVWSEGFAGIMDLDGAETLGGGEVWYSPDGIKWSERLDGPGPGDDVFTLVGHQGGLFALSGAWLEWDEDKTLWHRPADGSWGAVVTDPRLELLAVAGDRLFAYSQNGFEVVGVFDTVTLSLCEPVSIRISPTASIEAMVTLSTPEPVLESNVQLMIRGLALLQRMPPGRFWVRTQF